MKCTACRLEYSVNHGWLYDKKDRPFCDSCIWEEWDGGLPLTAKQFNKIGNRRRFGVELETCVSIGHNELADRTDWGCYDDGSCGAMEFYSPILQGNKGLTNIKSMVAKMNDLGFEVNRKCGFHLHVEVSDYPQSVQHRIIRAYNLTYDTWIKFVNANYRRHNEYCPRDPLYRIVECLDRGGRIADLNLNWKYCWLNVGNTLSSNSKGTFENRLHEGTLSYDKIKRWVLGNTNFISSLAELSDEVSQERLSKPSLLVKNHIDPFMEQA